MQIVQQVTPRLALTMEGKIERFWQFRRDQYVWMKRIDVIWKVEQLNVAEPQATPMRALSGQLFFAHEWPVTLDDFVYIVYDDDPKIRYVHLPTLYTFSARQINTRIFRDRFMTWPKRIFSHGRQDGKLMRPSQFILKYNRINYFSQLVAAKEVINVAA